MKFEQITMWPDKSSEIKPIADAALTAASKVVEEGQPPFVGVRVTLEAADEAALQKEYAGLRNQLAKFGRFDLKREGAIAYVRVSTRPARTKAVTKKATAKK